MASITTECRLFRSNVLKILPKHVTQQRDSQSQQLGLGLSLIRLHRDDSVADFTLPVKCLNLTKSLANTENKNDSRELGKVLETIPQASHSWPFSVTEANLSPESGILLKLDRSDTFEKVIRKYGLKNPSMFFLEKLPSFVVISASGRKEESKNANLEERNQLRCQLVSQHLSAVAQFIGLSVTYVTMPDDLSPTVHKLTEECSAGNQYSKDASMVGDLKQSRDSILQGFIKQVGKDSRPNVRNPEAGCDTSEGTDADYSQKQTRSASVKLKDLLLEHNVTAKESCTMKKNVGETEVLSEDQSPSRHLVECAKLEAAICEKEVAGKCSQVVALHISMPSQSHHQQNVEILWRCLSECCKHSIPTHITLGPVLITGVTDATSLESAASIFACYESELKEASAVKYGDDVQDNESEIQKRTILAKAAIKFDILSTAPGSPVKLDLSSRDRAAESRPGVFVLYNYARLATLFKKFHTQVESGIYPPLPPVEEVHFDCLREDAEWKLLLHHVMQFPDVVAETLGNICTVTPGQRCTLNSNRVCRFLYSLSKDLSVYYSRTHILGEPRPHLLPVMYARLYLLRSVMKVMADGLDLLAIKPLTYM